MKRTSFLLIALIPVLLFVTGCSKDEDPITPPAINEAELVIQALEGTDGGYLNKDCPSIVSAQQVHEDLQSAKKWYIVDVRAAADYAKGHIDGAVNVAIADILTHMKSITPANYEKIVIVCYTGQSAAFAVAILRMSGYANVSSMKYGMTSWHADFDRLSTQISSDYVSQFVTTETPKAAAGNLPTLATGKTTGAEILQTRIASVLADGYSKSAIDKATLFLDLSKYYIVNYWPAAEYTGIGHIPGSIQYTPKADLKLATFLKTLPTDKTIVIYCYTGQTSANVAAILRVMGYDAKTLAFGTNGMIWQKMKDAGKTAFNAASDVMNFPYVK